MWSLVSPVYGIRICMYVHTYLYVGMDPDGCTLPFLLDWAWDKLCYIKNEKDNNSK